MEQNEAFEELKVAVMEKVLPLPPPQLEESLRPDDRCQRQGHWLVPTPSSRREASDTRIRE